jgi:hypothetical protein
LLPVVACHYFDDFCCAEQDYSCDSAQQSLEQFMRLTGLDLGGVVGRDNKLVPAKKQTPSWLRTLLGVCGHGLYEISMDGKCAHARA